MQTIGVTDVEINYHRPAVNKRKIFGGLVSYGAVWRAGANENTTISFSTPVTNEGQTLPAGTYGLFMIPTATSWTVVFSKAAGTYQMSGVRELDSTATIYLINLAADPYLVTIGTVNFGGNSQVSFDAFGLPSSAGSITVLGGGITKTVTLDAVTGKASVQ